MSFFECVSKKEDVPPNILIFSQKQNFKKQFEEKNFDDNISFVISNSSYLNNEISFKYLKHFEKYKRRNQKGI